MKNVFLGTVFGLVLTTASFAQAHVAGCGMKYKVYIEGDVLYSWGKGSGTVTCSDITGKVTDTKAVTIAVDGLGPGIGQFWMRGVAAKLGIMNPKKLNGRYFVADATAAVGGGAGVTLGFEGENGLAFTAGANLGEGWGARLNGSTWTIRVKN